jgi:hypothetical protein
MTLAQAVQLTGPYIAVLLTAMGVPLTVAALRWLGARAAAITNQHWRTVAVDAVAAVEQTLTQAPSATKKQAALSVLTSAGVPVDTANVLLEAAVHALNAGAVQVLTTAPSTVTVAPPVVLPVTTVQPGPLPPIVPTATPPT